MTKTHRPSDPEARGRAEGYRSGLERAVADHLRDLGVDATYEGFTLQYVKPSRPSRYTPDFVLPNGIIVETKGRFVTADRQKHLFIRDSHPDLDIRFVFTNPNSRIGKQSATTYAAWCSARGFTFAHRLIPQAWIDEPSNPSRTKATMAALPGWAPAI